MKEAHITVPRQILKRLAGGRRGIRVGDLIRRVTEAIGIKPCSGCKDRQESFNRFKIHW